MTSGLNQLRQNRAQQPKRHNRNTKPLRYWLAALGAVTGINRLLEQGATLDETNQKFYEEMAIKSQDFTFAQNAPFGVSEKQMNYLLSIYHRLSEENEHLLEQLPDSYNQPDTYQQQQQQHQQPQQNFNANQTRHQNLDGSAHRQQQQQQMYPPHYYENPNPSERNHD